MEAPTAMDPASLAREAVSFIGELSNLHFSPLFNTLGNQRRIFFHGDDIYLRITDFLLDENERMRESASLQTPGIDVSIADITPEPPEPRWPWRLRELRGPGARQPRVRIDGLQAQLPESRDRSVRIYIEQGLGPQVFKNYFSADVTDATCRTYAHPKTRGYNGLSFQWRTPEPNAWFEAPSFILSGQDGPGLVINVKKVSTVEHSGKKLICKQFLITVLFRRTFTNSHPSTYLFGDVGIVRFCWNASHHRQQ